MKKISLVVLLFAFIAPPTFAGNTGKYYIATDLGSASYSNVTVAAGTYPDPGMARIAGGFHVSETVAIEVGYTNFGKSILTAPPVEATVTASSLYMAVVGSLPLSSQFDLIGKVGFANNKNKIDVTSSGVSAATTSASKSDVLIGFGAQYHISQQVTLRAQYDSFGSFGEFGTTGKEMKATAISFGVAYNF